MTHPTHSDPLFLKGSVIMLYLFKPCDIIIVYKCLNGYVSNYKKNKYQAYYIEPQDHGYLTNCTPPKKVFAIEL